MPIQKLPIESVIMDPAVLPRVQEDDPVVDEYAGILRLDPHKLPPPPVFQDGSKYWLADGVKRREANKRIGMEKMAFNVRKGARSDAIFYAAGANREHGVRLSNAEKKQAVLNCLSDPETAKNVDAAIAEQCGVSTSAVQKRRARLEKQTGKKSPKTRKTRKGKAVKAAGGGKGGRKKKKGPKPKKPPASDEKVFDALKDEVPDWCREVFVDQVEIANYWNGLSADVISPAEDLAKLPSGAGKLIEPKYIAGQVNEIRKHIQDAMPHAVCPECKDAGKLRPSCAWCKGTGWLTKPQYMKAYLA